MARNYDYLFKIVLIGNYGVGKTSLIQRFVDDTFDESITYTLGVDFKLLTVDIDGKKVKLQIWDAPGHGRCREISPTYYRGTSGTLLIYDTTDEKTYSEIVESWIPEVSLRGETNLNKVLIGNKSDLTTGRVVEYNTGKEFADSLGIPFFETSAKLSSNVSEAFMSMVRDILARKITETEDSAITDSKTVKVNKEEKSSRKVKCFL